MRVFSVLTSDSVKVVQKPPFGSELCVEPRRSILKIHNVFKQLNFSLRLDRKPVGRF